jgi:small subunit ribosomal protein S8
MPPVIDLIIRIKNGYMADNDIVMSPYSKFRESVLKKIQSLGYVSSYEIQEVEGKKTLIITLKYVNKQPIVRDVRIFSKPGKRLYTTAHNLKPVMGGYGYALISTSQGILTNIEAKKKNIGGELLFYIW